MPENNIFKFQLKRVNPFQGLVIDADTWRDAHNYHRDQQRLHLLVFHHIGIVEGLGVIASEPPDLSVTIQPGIAVDPEGNVIIVQQAQHYQLQTRQKGTVYLVIQFREVPAEPYQPPEAGQPTRIVEAYRVQEREKLPDEPHLELARIDYDPSLEAIGDAKTLSKPGKNEINLAFRLLSRPQEKSPVTPEKVSIPAAVETAKRPQKTVRVGLASLGGAGKELHSAGWKNLIREVNSQSDFVVELSENIPLDKDIKQYTLVCLTGNGQFEVNAEQQAALSGLLESGAVILGEGCSEGDEESRGAKEFGLAFNKLAGQLNCKLEMVQRGHPLLSAAHIFSEVPPGTEAAGMLLEGGHMIYCGNDYGCAWQGGHEDHPLARDIIRNSFEMGANIIAYAQMIKAEQ